MLPCETLGSRHFHGREKTQSQLLAGNLKSAPCWNHAYLLAASSVQPLQVVTFGVSIADCHAGGIHECLSRKLAGGGFSFRARCVTKAVKTRLRLLR